MAVQNRIFGTKLYDLFLSEMYTDSADSPFRYIERNQYIVNGTGNYYIEAQTRDQRRTDGSVWKGYFTILIRVLAEAGECALCKKGISPF